MEKRLMTVSELSEYLSIPKGSIYQMTFAQKIPADCIVKIGRSLRFEKGKIDAWVSSRTVARPNAQGYKQSGQ